MVKRHGFLSVIPGQTIFRFCWLAVCLLALAGCGGFAAPGESALADGVIFQDSFAPGETGPWLLEGDQMGRTFIDGEQLVIALDQPNTMQFATLAEPIFDDFTLEVDVRQVAGNPESSFGLLARMADPTQFYRFEITGAGLYMVERRSASGEWTQYLPDWTASPAINQGLNSPNRLKLVAQGASLAFYANDVLLYEVGDALFTTGTIALDAGTFGQGGLQVAFDNVVVSEAQ